MPRLEILLVEAQGLPSADLNGKSDPYVEICSPGDRQRSDVKKSTLNPVWRETKTVALSDPTRDAIGFLVYDWDRLSANDIIAYGFISLMGLPPLGAPPLDLWINLYKRTKKDSKKPPKPGKKAKPPKPAQPGGRLHIVIRPLDFHPPMPAMPMAPVGYPAQPYPGQPMPMPMPMPGAPYPGQPYPGQPYPGQPPMMAAAPMPMMQPLLLPQPFAGNVPIGFLNKCGFLRPQRTEAEAATQAAGKAAKKGLKALGKLLT